MKLLMSCFTAIIFYIFSGVLIETGCVYASSVRSITVTKITNSASAEPFTFTLEGGKDDDSFDTTFESAILVGNGDSFTWSFDVDLENDDDDDDLEEDDDDDIEHFRLTESDLPTGWFLQSISWFGVDVEEDDVDVDLMNNRVIFELDDDGGEFTAIFTNAVPIPSAVWLLASGLVGIVGFRKKFKK